MIRDIWTPSLIDILPPSILRDEKLKASAQALDLELKKLSADSKLVLHLPRLDELPHEVLDRLAWQYHVDFYEPAEMDLKTKRKLIRESLLWHRIKGTKAAVEKLLNSITRGAKISEWYEYGGKPYFFKVNLHGLLDYGDNGETFLRMINSTKNERSRLDAIDFDLTPDDNYLRLKLALIKLLTGKIVFYINDFPALNQSLQVFHTQLTAGKEIFKLNADKKTSQKAALRAGFINLTYGKIVFGAEITTPNDETIEDFERYIRRRWNEFKNNPVIRWYKHNTHGIDDGEIDDDEPEYFPVDTDFLRLYWGFDCGDNKYHLRYQTILKPRKDFTAKDINYLSAVGVEGKILLHSKLNIPTTGILRALYVKKTETKII